MTAQDTKKQILKASYDIMMKKGYNALSMRSVAKKVGITQSVLYYHFKNKGAILEHIFRGMLEKIQKEITSKTAHLSGQKKVEEIIFTMFKYGRPAAIAMQGNLEKGITIEKKDMEQNLMPLKDKLFPLYYGPIQKTLAEDMKPGPDVKGKIQTICEIIMYTMKGYGVIHIYDKLTEKDYRSFAKKLTNIIYQGI